MSQPPLYERQSNLSDYATSNPGAPYNPALVDSEFDAVQDTVNAIVDNIGLIQRDDGALQNAIVTPYSLSSDTYALMGDWLPRGAWVTTTAYAVRDMVSQTGNSYVCAVAHVSGTFSTDLAAGKWLLLAKNVTTAADLPFVPAGTITSTDVQDALEELDADITALDAGKEDAFAVLPVAKGGTGIIDLSAFIQTLLNDANQGEAQATLGVYSTATVDAAVAALVAKATLTAKGTLISASAASTPVARAAGTNGQVLVADSTHASGLNYESRTTQGTLVATTSGTSFNFPAIPAGTRWVKVHFRGVSLSGTDDILVQLGTAGGIVATGYISTAAGATSASTAVVTSTAGMVVRGAVASSILSGTMLIDLMDSATNVWISSHSVKCATTIAGFGGGEIALGGVLTQLTVTRSGTDTFDAGSINITYGK